MRSRLALTAMLCMTSSVSCDWEPEAPTGVTLTIASELILTSEVQVDAFLVRAQVGGGEPQSLTITLDDRSGNSSESVNLLFPHSAAGDVVSISVRALQGDVGVGDGGVEVTLVRNQMVASQVLLRLCLAAEAAYCEASEWISCDPITGRTVREACAFGCGEAMAGCRECTPGTATCNGDVYIACDANGDELSPVDCSIHTVGCRQGSCTASGCEVSPVPDGGACDDSLFCTSGTTCSGGVCGAGVPTDCADQNGCTFDTCDEAADSCSHRTTPLDGTACGDSTYCLINKSCSAGLCTGGVTRDCDDGNACTNDSCDEGAGSCAYVDAGDGAACDDGDFCTTDDACVSMACVGGITRSCDDSNPCTTDGCDGATGRCENAAVGDGQPCLDGSFCVVSKTCALGVCAGGVPRACNDGNVCTLDSCDETAGECVVSSAVLDGSPCSDGSYCTVGETCTGGSCDGGGARDCDDSNSCTTDSCDESGGTCAYADRADGAPCEDGQFCTTGDACTSGSCVTGTGTPCADGNPCTNESCDEANAVCAYACADAAVTCVGDTQEATCDGTCALPSLRECGDGCNTVRQVCNECTPSTVTCAGDASLLCNAETVCDAAGLITSQDCCISNRCTCDGASCLEDICTAAPDMSAGGNLAGNTCTSTDDIPGDCAAGGYACRPTAAGGGADDFFQFAINDTGAASAFYNVELDASASALDSRLRVSTVCGNEAFQVSNAHVCTLPEGAQVENACLDEPGANIMMLCGVPSGTYFGAVDSGPGLCDAYSMDVTLTPVTLNVTAEAGNITRGGQFFGTTCGLTDDFAFPDTVGIPGSCDATNDCAAGMCPACGASAATDCTVGEEDDICSYSGAGNPDAVFYLALDVDAGVDISTRGSDFDTVLFIAESGATSALPFGDVKICNDDCTAVDGPSHIQTTLPAGLYYVFVDGAGPAGACGNYVLDVTVAPAATCPNLACEAPFESCTTCPSDCYCDACGDGVWTAAEGENCDDANRYNGDGCDVNCAIEPGFKCGGSPSVCAPHCGDGIVDSALGETCDDANLSAGDGCDSACSIEVGFVCEGLPNVCREFVSITSCPGISIPDATTGGVVDVVSVPAGASVHNVAVDLHVTHTYIGDLTIDLIAPESTTVRLHDRSGGTTEDIDRRYDETFPAEGPGVLADFAGIATGGNWSLQVVDAVSGDAGTLDCWTLTVVLGAICGDGKCHPASETCSDCAADCACAQCGDGTIQLLEGERCDDGNLLTGDGCGSLCEAEADFLCSGEPSLCVPALSFGNCPGLAIPEGDLAGASDIINIPDSFLVGDVTVDVTIPHTYIGDLTVDLISPAGTTTRLHDRTGGSADDIVGNYDNTLQPDGPGAMSDFDGELALGDWTLTAVDMANSDLGEIACWNLIIYPAYICGNGSCEGSLGETCAACPADCLCANCGDAVVSSAEGEACDDDNLTGGDGCSASCEVEPGFECSGSPSVCLASCGDGGIDPGEACDDSGIIDGDGCDATCAVETGWLCSGDPSVCHQGIRVTDCPNMDIRDGRGQGDTVAINVPMSCSVSNVLVGVEIIHSWIGDLILDITSPSGTSVRLHDRSGSFADYIVGEYDTTLMPDGPGVMSDFDAGQSAGKWELKIADEVSGFSGTLDCWSLEIECM